MGLAARNDDANESDKVGLRRFPPAEARPPTSSRVSSELKCKSREI
jgi:hypothetical protein